MESDLWFRNIKFLRRRSVPLPFFCKNLTSHFFFSAIIIQMFVSIWLMMTDTFWSTKFLGVGRTIFPHILPQNLQVILHSAQFLQKKKKYFNLIRDTWYIISLFLSSDKICQFILTLEQFLYKKIVWIWSMVTGTFSAFSCPSTKLVKLFYLYCNF